VDRQDGAASYESAVRNLKDGELVGVYPEATISRSFEIKEFKAGAARMSIEAGCRSSRTSSGVHSGSGPKAAQEPVAAEGADHGARR